MKIDTAYVTASPCITCVKYLIQSSCGRIVFLEEYPHPEAKELWLAAGRAWERQALDEHFAKHPSPGEALVEGAQE